MSSDVVIVYCTMPAGDVPARIARTIVDERLVACVNLLPGVASIYRWQGEVQQDDEVLAIMKTTAKGFEALRVRLVELHPYDCPEIIATEVAVGHPPYLDWVVDNTK